MPISIQNSTESPCYSSESRERNKTHFKLEKKVSNYPFADDMILYRRKPTEDAPKFVKTNKWI